MWGKGRKIGNLKNMGNINSRENKMKTRNIWEFGNSKKTEDYKE